ncbi:TAXI family TRAP transporter solute-binding subunit [Gudongella sp. SC589]|uniref:TAXI family TRAP transporter solute-binding subunit n=1 Tax=Gudongella sp. SC589 TaxID=3385990 RepID=UPI0039046C31
MKRIISIALVLVLVAGVLAGCGNGGDGEVTYLKFPTASTTGAIYPIGAAISNLWNENIEGLNVSVEASNGGVQNLGLVAQGEAQIGVAVTNIMTEQKNGTGVFEGQQYDGIRVLTALYSNYNQVVVGKDSGIETLRDIKGKVFAPGAPGSTPEVETNIHLTAAGLKYPDDFSPQFVGFTESIDLIRNKQLDGAWLQAGIPTSAVSEILSTAGGRLVSIDEDVIAQLTEEYPWYNRAIIPAGTYENQDYDVVTTSIVITIFVDESLPEETVYQMTKVFWENVESLGSTHNAIKGLELEQAVQNLAGLPLHEGSAKYYREMGIME